MSLKQLPPDTIRLISSTQVITSASSVVKELLENSIDAHATTVNIRLENYGLDKIEIHDNGVGISHSDVHMMCLRGYTSKISDISDLDKLKSYGFRGEALSSVCAVADVTIITKSELDNYAKLFTMDKNGHVKSSSISHHQKGTVIKILNLFKNLPVRKQIYNSKKHCTNDLRRIENIVKSLAAIQQNIRVSLVHNKSVLWQMTPVNDLTVTFGQIWSSSMTKYVKQLSFSNEEIKIDIVLPIQNIDLQNCFFTTNLTDAIYLYVNKRPVRDNKIEKLIAEEFSNYFGHKLPPGKYLPCFISLTIPAETIDINLEPDKSRILFHNQEMIILNIKNCITKHFYDDGVQNIQLNTNEIQLNQNKRKISFDSDEIKVKKSAIEDSDSCRLNAESTKIINESYEFSDEDHIIKELSLEEIDFEEPLTLKENKNDNIIYSKNNELEGTDNITEYHKKLMNIRTTVPLKTIQSDNTKVTNFDAENISISQWSKGDVVLNGKLLKSGVSIKFDFSHATSEKETIPEIEKTSEVLNSKYTSESLKDELNAEVKNTFPVYSNKSISDTPLNSTVKLAPLFRTVSVPDEQVPGLNHLVNRPQSWTLQPRSKRPLRDVPEEDLSETVRSVSSQMGNKEMSGFTLFAKEKRIKILEENPGMDFTKVSKELAKSWSCLSADEKAKYKELANKQKNCVMTAKRDTELPKKSFQFIFKNLKRFSTLINVEFSEIKKNIFEKPKVLPLSPYILIGEVKDNNWICCIHNEIKAVNVCRLQEAVVFFLKMANDEIPLKMLDQSIKTNKKYLGEKNYRFLMDLDNSYELSTDKCTITDERIVKNGFNVVIEFIDNSENADINITGVALHISKYGAEELKQLLELMQLKQENNLYSCRPLKVIHYLKSETVRHCKTIGQPKTKEDIYKLFNQWFKNDKFFSNNTCIHDKPVFESIHIINENHKY